MDSRRQVRRAALLAVATAAVALLGASSALGQVTQTPKNGCESPQTYFGAITSPSFNTGSTPASVSFLNWWEIESVDPSRDPMTVQYSLDPGVGNPRSWDDIGQINTTAPPSSGLDIGYSNNGLLATPSFTSSAQTFTLPPAAVSQNNVQVRIVFETLDGLYNGFRGLGVDNVAVSTGGGSSNFTQNFEGALGTWTLDPAPSAGAPGWQVIDNSNTITVKSPEIAPDLVTLPDNDGGELPDTSAGTSFAWFGDDATGTYCGPDFANRFVPEQPLPPGQTGTTTPQIGQARRTTLADLPKPVLGKLANVEPAKGTVLVAIPVGKATARGASVGEAIASQKGLKFVPLAEARQVPVGSFLDTRRGTVRLQSATASPNKTSLGSFDAGLFQVLQSRKKSAKGLTDLVIKGGNVRSCAPKKKRKAGRRASSALSRKSLRRLRGNAKGRFRTRGRFSAATVRGTKWTVTDRCDGTLTKVTRGRVAVRDFRRKRTIQLKRGKSYLAKAPG